MPLAALRTAVRGRGGASANALAACIPGLGRYIDYLDVGRA